MARPAVILYATAGCPTCDAARGYLRARGAEFEDVEVKADGAAVRELVRVAGHAVVPTLVVGDDVQAGWDQARVAEMLDDPLPDEPDELAAIFADIERHLDREDAAAGQERPELLEPIQRIEPE